jgi:hypothetical protein
VGISVERARDGNVITLNHRLRMMVRDRAWRWVPRRMVMRHLTELLYAIDIKPLLGARFSS